MGIIERAVGRLDQESKVRPRPTRRHHHDAPVLPPDHGRGGEEEIVVSTRNIAAVGPSAVEEDAALARDFKFLKRPLLSRVFGRTVEGEGAARGHVVLVTSDQPGAGKSFVSLNLAASIAQEQLTEVILIDADPLRRNLSINLQQQDRPGLLEVISDVDLDPADFALQTDVAALRFLPAGQPDPNCAELLASRRLTKVLGSMDEPDTVVLLDTSPLLLTAEARVLAERADHTVIVVEAGRSSLPDVASMLKMLGDVRSSISFVLNKVPISMVRRKSGYHYYGYHYGY